MDLFQSCLLLINYNWQKIVFFSDIDEHRATQSFIEIRREYKKKNGRTFFVSCSPVRYITFTSPSFPPFFLVLFDFFLKNFPPFHFDWIRASGA